jgi:hypothetical protein
MMLTTSNKAGSAHRLVGSGDHVYEVIHDWGELPPKILYGNTHGVCEDSQGFIYVHHTVHKDSQSHDAMVVFDADGKFVTSWGPEFKGGAHGLHIQREGGEDFLYLCDKNRAIVVKTTIKGDGYGSGYINQYDRDGKYVRTFGGKGDEAGRVNCPHGIIVDTRHDGDPILNVADRGNNRIQRFTLDGKQIDFVAGTNMPCHFAFSTNGDMVVPDLAARVTLMNRDNKVIEHLGDDSASEWQTTRIMSRDRFTPGKFIAPHGACFDHEGNIFVVEWVEVGRVTKLRKV